MMMDIDGRRSKEDFLGVYIVCGILWMLCIGLEGGEVGMIDFDFVQWIERGGRCFTT